MASLAREAANREARLSEPVAARLYNDHVRKQERFRAMEAELEAKEAENAPTFTPSLAASEASFNNGHGGRGGGSGGNGNSGGNPGELSDRLERWRQRRAERREEAMRSVQEEQASQMRGTPQINRRSAELADELVAQGLRDPNVSEHLYAQAPQIKDKILRMKATQMANENPATPLITRMAAELDRSGPVGDRLYNNALETRSKLLKAREDAEAAENYRAARGGPTPETKAKVKSGRVGHSLYERARATMAKKDQMRQQKQRDINKMQRQSHMTREVRPNARSRRSPRVSVVCFYSFSFFGVTQNAHTHIQYAIRICFPPAPPPSPFFVCSEQSQKLVAGREPPLERLSQMTPTARREVELWKIKQEMAQEACRDSRQLAHQNGSAYRLSDNFDKELTFQPAVNPISAQIAEVRNARSGRKNFGDRLYNDSKTWRKKSVARLREEQVEKELAECTFTPNVSSSSRTFSTAMGYDVEVVSPSREDDDEDNLAADQPYTEEEADEKGEEGDDDDDDEDVGNGGAAALRRQRRKANRREVATPDRLQRWQENRDRKIHKMRMAKAAQVTSGCTFHPNTSQSQRSRQRVPAGTGAPRNIQRRVAAQSNNKANRQRRASVNFYARQKRAQDMAQRTKQALSPNQDLHHMQHHHPDLKHGSPSPHLLAGDHDPEMVQNLAGSSDASIGHLQRHMDRMARARAHRALERNAQMENQLRNPYSVSGSTNPDLISINAERSHVPKPHQLRRAGGNGQGRREKKPFTKALRPPVGPGAVALSGMWTQVQNDK